jgi:hypothetical protein
MPTMHEPNPPTDPADDHLAMQAFLFACGELEESEAVAFFHRLADEQAAREALSQAVYVSGFLAGGTPVAPNPAYRAAVRGRLGPGHAPLTAGGGRARFVHALLWAGVGAAAMYLLSTGMGLRLPNRVWGPDPVPAISTNPAHLPDEAPPSDESVPPAVVWAVLHTPEHLAQVHDEEGRRKSRAHELHRLLSRDERRFHR